MKEVSHLSHFGLKPFELLVDPLVLLQLSNGGPLTVQVRAWGRIGTESWGEKREGYCKWSASRTGSMERGGILGAFLANGSLPNYVTSSLITGTLEHQHWCYLVGEWNDCKEIAKLSENTKDPTVQPREWSGSRTSFFPKTGSIQAFH